MNALSRQVSPGGLSCVHSRESEHARRDFFATSTVSFFAFVLQKYAVDPPPSGPAVRRRIFPRSGLSWNAFGTMSSTVETSSHSSVSLGNPAYRIAPAKAGV